MAKYVIRDKVVLGSTSYLAYRVYWFGIEDYVFGSLGNTPERCEKNLREIIENPKVSYERYLEIK